MIELKNMNIELVSKELYKMLAGGNYRNESFENALAEYSSQDWRKIFDHEVRVAKDGATSYMHRMYVDFAYAYGLLGMKPTSLVTENSVAYQLRKGVLIWQKYQPYYDKEKASSLLSILNNCL